MSGLDPSGPAQPSLNTAYNTSGNAATKEPAEKSQSDTATSGDSQTTDRRVPTKQTSSIEEATPTSMARGVRGAGPGEDSSKLSDQDAGRTADVDAEQMRAPGEGEVVDAVQRKPGAEGEAPGLETDLDRKKAEQAPLRDSIQGKEEGQVDVAGVLEQRKN